MPTQSPLDTPDIIKAGLSTKTLDCLKLRHASRHHLCESVIVFQAVRRSMDCYDL